MSLKIRKSNPNAKSSARVDRQQVNDQQLKSIEQNLENKQYQSLAEKFGAEIHDAYSEILGEVGQSDLKRVKRLIKISAFLKKRGRRLIATSNSPISWASGIRSLIGHYTMEFAIGHVA